MATHIIRIYRMGKEPPPWASGLVEAVQGAARYPFHSAEELWAILLELQETRPSPTHGTAVETEEADDTGTA